MRERGASDRRQKTVRLTVSGYDALKQSTLRAQDFNHAVMAGMTTDDIVAAERVLAAMRGNLLGMGGEDQTIEGENAAGK